MKARTWFFALGQSHEARRMPYALCVVALRLNHLPHWAKQAYTAGRLSVMHEGFGKRITHMASVLNIPLDVVLATGAPSSIAVAMKSEARTFKPRDPEPARDLDVFTLNKVLTASPDAADSLAFMLHVVRSVPGDKSATTSGHARGVAAKSEGSA